MKKKKQKTSFSPIKEEEKDEPLNLHDEAQVKSNTLIIQRFFKVMPPDFRTTIRLPLAFCKKLMAGIPENAVVISRKGTWNVKIGGCMNGQVCLKEGWDKFAEAHELRVGDFVVFEHQGNMHFKIMVYDSSCCENEFSSYIKEEDEADFGPDIYERASRKIKRGPRMASSSQFTVKVTSRNCLYIPRSFCKANKIDVTTKLILSGPSGELCEVKLNCYANKIVHTTGRSWLEFRKSNGVKDGDICLFKLSSDPSTGTCPIKMNVQVIQAPN